MPRERSAWVSSNGVPEGSLHAEVFKIAKRMSMVAVECLSVNKQAINQTFEIMGLMAALKAGNARRPAQLDGHARIPAVR